MALSITKAAGLVRVRLLVGRFRLGLSRSSTDANSVHDVPLRASTAQPVCGAFLNQAVSFLKNLFFTAPGVLKPRMFQGLFRGPAHQISPGQGDYVGFVRLLPSRSSARGGKALTYILKATWLLIYEYDSGTSPNVLTCFITVSLNTKHVASIGVIWLLEYQRAGRGETERSHPAFPQSRFISSGLPSAVGGGAGTACWSAGGERPCFHSTEKVQLYVHGSASRWKSFSENSSGWTRQGF